MKQKDEEYQTFREIGIRLTEGEVTGLSEHDSQKELPMLYTYHMFDKAHLVMLAEENIIPREDAVKMLKALREMEAEGVEKVRLEVGGGMHSGEPYLIRKLSQETGGKMHIGRSTGDLGEIGRRVKQRDELLKLMVKVNDFRETLIRGARKYRETIMPGFSVGQPSQSLTLGHLLLSWASVLERDFERAESVYKRVNVSSTGAAIMTGSNFPINRHRTAELLGFDRPAKNTHDAIMSHDVSIEVIAVLALLNASLSRWAEDIILWFTPQFGWIEVPDRFCGTSSIMPQKKNPIAMGHLKGAFSYAVGGLITNFLTEEDPTGFAVIRNYAMDAVWNTFDYTIRHLEWLKELISSMKVNKESMKESASTLWTQATDLAGALVREKGLPWRTAHQIVGILVRISIERGIKPQEVTTKLLDEASMQYNGKLIGLSAASLKKALNPVEFVKGRTLYGGPAPEEVLRRIPDFEEILKQDRAKLASWQNKLKKAAQKLEKAIDTLIG